MTQDKYCKSDIVFIIYDAFLNEMALEKHIKKERLISFIFFDYKVLQFSTYFSKPNYIYLFLLICLCFLFIAVQFVISIILFFIGLLFFAFPQFRKKNLIVLTSSKQSLIEGIKQFNLKEEDFILSNKINLLTRVSKSTLLGYVFFFFYFTFYVIKKRENIFLFFLNYKDLFDLYLLSMILYENPDLLVISDDHYQRNAFLISNLHGGKYYVLQHGFIDPKIMFPKKFGKIKKLLIHDLSYLKIFENYFEVEGYAIFNSNSFTLSSRAELINSCFLASSSPHIDFELEFVKQFKSKYDIKIIIKKHPKHVYNNLKYKQLVSIVDEEWTDNETFPNSSLFISYSSFLETYYKSIGSFTFSLASFSKIEDVFTDSKFLESVKYLQIKSN
ncbi:hypothetical protein [Sediminibacterium sp.]|uniref:hypothetical protein n=1 Tax=Sediminibacterium sp. TaxID=1917865 RepID=UPI00272F94B2|nr:hypothetical protein [Sediminibacterium sp.]MDP2420246.1 hypothetical protein [Sediminibacterium sp.]